MTDALPDESGGERGAGRWVRMIIMEIVKKMITGLFLAAACFNCIYFNALAAETFATGGTKEELAAAVNQAQNDDTIRIPAGSYEFRGTLVITKGVKIIGAGLGSTIIHREPADDLVDKWIAYRNKTEGRRTKDEGRDEKTMGIKNIIGFSLSWNNPAGLFLRGDIV